MVLLFFQVLYYKVHIACAVSGFVARNSFPEMIRSSYEIIALLSKDSH